MDIIGWIQCISFFLGMRGRLTSKMKLKNPNQTGKIDLVFMPIGAYAPDVFQDNHCTPEQAWEMFQDIGAKWLVPIHWDTFILSGEPVDEPLQRLFQAAGAKKDRIVITEHGQIFSFQKAIVTSA
jgi:L-ascorbate metabolism protein UlaG (beta-lactamase superfamily)